MKLFLKQFLQINIECTTKYVIEMICYDNKSKYFHYDFEQFQMVWCGIFMKASSKLPLSKIICFIQNSSIDYTWIMQKKTTWVYNGKFATENVTYGLSNWIEEFLFQNLNIMLRVKP